MEITVTSMETIKPSSPTPQHLQHLNLSLIDQFMLPPTVYTHVLLFFPARGDVNRFQATDMSNRLRTSLSEVLAEFYPVAGKFHDCHSIHCNDQGLEYVEARVKAPLTLARVLSSPRPEEISRLFPEEAQLDKLSAVRVTIFDACGGMVVGVSLSHVVADASSLAMFVNSWAAVARNAPRVPVKIGFASLFPPKDMPELEAEAEAEAAYFDEPGMPQRKLVTKRFVFDQMKINALKANLDYRYPSRVEAVFALVFKCLINVAKSSSARSVASFIAINLRSRLSTPPLPVQYFGNFAFPLVWEHTDAGSLKDLGHQLRRLFKEIDSDSLLADNARLLSETFEDLPKLFMKNVRVFGLTSWCRLPFYEVDFGWGVPTWAATFFPNQQDDILVLDAKDGQGVEAWVTMAEDDIERFETDAQLLDFACANPMVSDQY